MSAASAGGGSGGPSSVVIVGASLAGAKAAETLRKEGFDGEVVLVGEETFRPYERPPLSKDLLRGDVGREKAYVHDESFYADNGIDLRLSCRVESIDVGARRVGLAGGEQVPYDSLLLATGAAPRRVSVPGADLAGVHYLRTLADSESLAAAVRSAGRVAVIGGGWIGSEVAASARQMGAEVSMIEAAPVPLVRVLGPELGAFYRDVHADHGVDLHLGVGLQELRGSGSVEEVVLADGTVIAADVVVIGVGVTPRVELAEAAGLELDNGVVTDQFLAASVPGVYAAGDVASAWHPVLERRVRLEHWSSALNQGPVAARNILGRSIPYDKLPYFFSDQYDVGMEYTGLAMDWDEVVFRGDVGRREFIAFWLKDGRVEAGMNVNVWDVTDAIGELVRSRRPVDRARLADPEVDLGAVLA
jgi:3-phenylpropionate/trans-cinnamate dioxygenase ferredoxin reductase component